MTTQVTTEFHPHVAVINGSIKTTSIKVAEHFGKRHDNVLRAIEKLECSPKFTALNFELSKYKDASGKTNPFYEITRDGFTFLAMGFTGKEAAKWKEAYINAFNAMAETLNKPQPPTNPVYQSHFPAPDISLFEYKFPKALRRLINQRAWHLSQPIARAHFNAMRKALRQDMENYLAIKGPTVMVFDECENWTPAGYIPALSDYPSNEPALLAKDTPSLKIDLNTHAGLQQLKLKFDCTDKSYGRWTVTLADGEFTIKPLETGEFITNSSKLPQQIADSIGSAVAFNDLINIIKAATDRIEKHLRWRDSL
jgi:Rha family phage regulatory protein